MTTTTTTMPKTTVRIGGAPAPRLPEPAEGSLTKLVLGSGGIKIAAYRGTLRLGGGPAAAAAGPEQRRLAWQSPGPPGLWMLVADDYLVQHEALGPTLEAPAQPVPSPAASSSSEPAAASTAEPTTLPPAVGDRILVELRNHLIYSGYYFGTLTNPLAGRRRGLLLGFTAAAPLLYWFDEALVHRTRVTIPGALDEPFQPGEMLAD
jgi:hypothetical protein